MDVLPLPEGGDHVRIPGDVGQKPQLDLGVVRVHQHVPRPGDEHLAQLGPQLGAHGDVLQIGFGRREPPRGRYRILEGGVDAPVGGDDLGQTLHIGGGEFGVLPVLQHVLHDGRLPAQLLQHLGVGGVARLGLFHRGQAHFVEEDVPELLGREDIELLPRLLIDALLHLGDAVVEHPAEGGQGLPVHQHSRVLDVRQHRAQGQLHLPEEFPHLQLLQAGGHDLLQRPDEGGVTGQGLLHRRPVGQGGKGVFRQIRLLRPEILPLKIGQAQFFQLVAAVGGREQIGRQRGVKDKALAPDAPLQQAGEQGLDVVGVFGNLPRKELPQNLSVVFQASVAQKGRPDPALLLPPGHAHRIQAGQGQHVHAFLFPPEGEQFRRPGGAGGGLTGTRRLRRVLRSGHLPLRGLQPQLVDEFGKLQL